MRVELICIGNELLNGRTINTNATLFARKLQQMGLNLARVITIGDTEEELIEALERGFEKCDYLFTTWGLGPTSDDLTRDILCQFFQTRPVYNEEVAADLKKRFGSRECGLKNQATIPENAEPLLNPVGTAPGLCFTHKAAKLFVLPGVPLEVEALLDQTILPRLALHAKAHHSQEVKLMLVNESRMAPFMQCLELDYPDAAFGSYPETGYVGIRFSTPHSENLSAIRQRIEREYLTSFFYSESATQALQNEMIKRGKRLVLAESCTGGSLAARLTAVSGSSDYFEGSIVSYSNSLKEGVLHVSQETLKCEGAVSQKAVEEMALGVLQISKEADFSIAISGIAGPMGGTLEKPVGTVWAALVERGSKPMSGLVPCQHKKTRTSIIDYCDSYMIAALWKWLVHREEVLK